MANPTRIEFIAQELAELHNDDEFKYKFTRLMDLMHEIAEIKGWWEPPKTFTEQCMMMVTEISEVIEEYRTETGDINNVFVRLEDGKPEGVPIELADLFIRLADTCTYYRINLIDQIIYKALFNLQRPQRHGNKKV